MMEHKINNFIKMTREDDVVHIKGEPYKIGRDYGCVFYRKEIKNKKISVKFGKNKRIDQEPYICIIKNELKNEDLIKRFNFWEECLIFAEKFMLRT